MPVDTLIQSIKMEMGKMYGHLNAMNARLEDLYIRGQIIIRQTEKLPREKIQDTNYDVDFVHLRVGMRSLAIRADDFYRFVLKAYKIVKLTNPTESSNKMARGLLLVSRHFRLQVEKFLELLLTARPIFRKIPITVYWWDLDKTAGELFKTSVLILEHAKELNEYTMQKTETKTK